MRNLVRRLTQLSSWVLVPGLQKSARKALVQAARVRMSGLIVAWPYPMNSHEFLGTLRTPTAMLHLKAKM